MHTYSTYIQYIHTVHTYSTYIQYIHTVCDVVPVLTGLYPLLSSSCDKSFFEAKDLQQHMNKHLGLKPFQCQVGNNTINNGALFYQVGGKCYSCVGLYCIRYVGSVIAVLGVILYQVGGKCYSCVGLYSIRYVGSVIAVLGYILSGMWEVL
jgi:hypothetical protein